MPGVAQSWPVVVGIVYDNGQKNHVFRGAFAPGDGADVLHYDASDQYRAAR